ncbi:hypothetical protein [Natronoglycomyces albus]|uniref:Uncharacterized protein n=1 Tax=Natronoglycomyces albus TaxID=2811108 RepID=A0A895XYE0_9ACTN|nr:hypothetical protein [Natronoglycomyces albus]QSB07200.1 hypothetical protein JQS30_16990 [Natronoglycomyces albus]
MFEKSAFAATAPGVGVSSALAAPMSFGALQSTSISMAEGLAGVYDPTQQVTILDGAPLALSTSERTPWETREDSQTWPDREA